MTEKQKTTITDYRKMGFGYKKISQLTGINENTIKSYCKRNDLGGKAALLHTTADTTVCKCCGSTLIRVPGKKAKKFCSDTCRAKWWNQHLGMVNRKSYYSFVCPVCGKAFTAYGNAKRKYCSSSCYISSRFGSGQI